jgi:anti-sigma factor RsiW
MSDTLDRWEIQIGRFLDGELSPQERSRLEAQMEQDKQAKELFERMRVLHECSCGVVTHEVLERGADPADVFERAWQQSKRSFWRGGARGGLERQGWRWGARADRYLRFAVGVAAGLLLGLVLRFTPLSNKQTLSNLPSQPRVAEVVPSRTYSPVEVGSPTPDNTLGATLTPVRANPRRVTREVNWYVYTDGDGNQWLIEGTQQGRVRSAAYPEGL